jgi:hypothetical protein
MRIHHIVMCALPRSYNIFALYFTNGMIFEKRLLNIKICVSMFFISFVWNIFILRITERDVLKMYVGLCVKYPLILSDLNETCIFLRSYSKIRKYLISYKSVQWEPSNSMRTGGRMDGRRNRHVKDNSRFSQFCGRTKQGFPTTRIITNSPCIDFTPS